MPFRKASTDELRIVYRKNAEAVYAFFAYSVSEHTAEDLTSATFEKVLRNWRSFDPGRGSERAWILAIARNVLTDHYRRESYRQTASTDAYPALLEALGGVDDQNIQRVLSSADLRGLMGQLGERERQVLALRFGADLQAGEIGEVLDLTPANVHQIISRSLRRLREAAEREGELRSSA